MKRSSTTSEGAPPRRPLKDCDPGVKAEEEDAPAGVTIGEKAPAAKNRMPESHVQWILAQKPLDPPARYAALKEKNPDLIPRPEEEADEDLCRLYLVAKAFYEMEEQFPKEQERVREEMRTKGYVEVSDDWLKQRAEVREVVDREWPKIEAKIEAMIEEDKEYAKRRDIDENDYYEEEED